MNCTSYTSQSSPTGIPHWCALRRAQLSASLAAISCYLRSLVPLPWPMLSSSSFTHIFPLVPLSLCALTKIAHFACTHLNCDHSSLRWADSDSRWETLQLPSHAQWSIRWWLPFGQTLFAQIVPFSHKSLSCSYSHFNAVHFTSVNITYLLPVKKWMIFTQRPSATHPASGDTATPTLLAVH